MFASFVSGTPLVRHAGNRLRHRAIGRPRLETSSRPSQLQTVVSGSGRIDADHFFHIYLPFIAGLILRMAFALQKDILVKRYDASQPGTRS